MDLFLTLLSGIGWMIVYEECIRLGFKDKSSEIFPQKISLGYQK